MLLKVNKYSLYVSSRTTSLVPSTKDMVAELLAVCVLINIKLPQYSVQVFRFLTNYKKHQIIL